MPSLPVSRATGPLGVLLGRESTQLEDVERALDLGDLRDDPVEARLAEPRVLLVLEALARLVEPFAPDPAAPRERRRGSDVIAPEMSTEASLRRHPIGAERSAGGIHLRVRASARPRRRPARAGGVRITEGRGS